MRQFPRDRKYTLGSELRGQAMTGCRLVARAAHAGDPGQRLQRLERLRPGRRQCAPRAPAGGDYYPRLQAGAPYTDLTLSVSWPQL